MDALIDSALKPNLAARVIEAPPRRLSERTTPRVETIPAKRQHLWRME